MSNVPPPPPSSPSHGQVPAGPPPGTPPGSQPASSKGLIGRIFDLSFSEFVTPSIIKLIFIIGIIGAGLAAVGIFAVLAAEGGGGVVFGLILAPLVFFVYVLLIRVMAEIYLILFKIEENTRKR